ncbi:cytochrome b [Porphyrobacter sp. LM 6]|jgi:cytochrome b561|uniref:cytochrome b n=1 Tax=Porphyrobacter sp. LM 6 TaxID=1896196 RepID=UPI0008472C3C|nr:cytochrome b [Porphyrobacter sp. LM 6]AOL94431.1 cytochrome b561 [Porphyrobacter sp. LM 6]
MSLNTKTKYSGLAMTLHWLVGIAVIASWRIAEAAEHAATREEGSQIMGNHFALGVVIFTLMAVRLASRLMNPPPPPVAGHAGWERMLAKVTHLAMYTLLLVMPIAGWLAMSMFDSGISVWGIVEVPKLPVAPNEAMAEQIFETHALAGTTLLVLIAVHILATLKHTLIDKDGTLFRMLPFGTAKG